MKNKILKYDCLIIGSGLLGSLLAISLIKKQYKVLVLEKEGLSDGAFSDQRTLAVNANSRNFLKSIDLWDKLNKKHVDIGQISIKTYLNKDELIFKEQDAMGSVIFNKELLSIAHKILIKEKSIMGNTFMHLDQLQSDKNFKIKNKDYVFKKIIIMGGKQFINQVDTNHFIKGDNSHKAYVGFFNHQKNHQNIAYENFTKNGPLAILPAPHKTNKYSTFIYSTQDTVSSNSMKKLIDKL